MKGRTKAIWKGKSNKRELTREELQRRTQGRNCLISLQSRECGTRWAFGFQNEEEETYWWRERGLKKEVGHSSSKDSRKGRKRSRDRSQTTNRLARNATLDEELTGKMVELTTTSVRMAKMRKKNKVGLANFRRCAGNTLSVSNKIVVDPMTLTLEQLGNTLTRKSSTILHFRVVWEEETCWLPSQLTSRHIAWEQRLCRVLICMNILSGNFM